MTISEAFESALQGNFVTHESFDPDQSLHYWNGTHYYEDGAMVTIRLLRQCNEEAGKPLFEDGWKLKAPKEEIDQEKLDEMHKEAGGFMLTGNETYEACIRN